MALLRTALVIIDPQIDFHPGGSLAVAGADEDAERIAGLIRTLGPKLTNIIITLDSHHKNHVAHSMVWVNQDGQHPSPFTLITSDDIRSGNWRAADPKRQQLVASYVEKLEAKGRFKLIIWPDHCIIASRGNNVTPPIHDASQEWVVQTGKYVRYLRKGENINTEMYSAIQAEVPDELDKSTSLNQKFVDELRSFDKVIVCGQALSHCVNFTVRDLVDNWKRDNSDIIVLTDGSSPVGSFEASGEEFLQYCRDSSLTLHTCDSLLTAWDSFVPSQNKGPLYPVHFTVPSGMEAALSTEKLVAAVKNRRAAEIELNKLLSKRLPKSWFVNSLKVESESIAALNGFAAGITSSIEDAVLGDSGSLLKTVPEDIVAEDFKFVVIDELAVVREDSTGRYSSLSEEQGALVRLITFSSNKISFAGLLSKPFVDGVVAADSLSNYSKLAGLTLEALRTYAQYSSYFRGDAYRGGKFVESPKIQELYSQVTNGSEDRIFNVGSTITFPAFGSLFTNQADSDDQFGSDFVFVFNIQHDIGVDVTDVSYFGIAGEIAVIPPAAFVVRSINTENNKLVIKLDSVESTVSYDR